MSVINYAAREITCKLVYYGPGLCGKTTNVQHIHATTRDDRHGKLISLATETERTLFFDFMPMSLGSVAGFELRLHLYTVPGQVFYAAARRLILRGCDGLVFVADSQASRFEANLESLEDLRLGLADLHVDLSALPTVLQCNKQDIPGVMAPAELQAALGLEQAPCIPAAAIRGEGVFETLRALSRGVVRRLRDRSAAARSRQARPPEPPSS